MPPQQARRRLPFRALFRQEAAGGLVLLAAALVAFIWANSPFSASYAALVEWTAFASRPEWTLRALTNDGLMALFFLVVGVDIRRELTSGELRGNGRAALPLVGALGGMLVPAGIYLALNPSPPARLGFGVPVATDIAFALGCLSLVKRRVPASLFVFLTALAIFDDIGAVAVIAFFYGGTSVALPLLGFVLGVAVPAVGGNARSLARLRALVTFAILPLFALVNAGVALDGTAGAGDRITLGVFFGLVLGKPLGIALATVLAVKAKLAPWPERANVRQVLGVCALAGVGFTMSLVVGNLAFTATPALENASKLGVLAGSVVAAALGLGILVLPSRRAASPPAGDVPER